MPGSRLDADHPEKGVLFARRITGQERHLNIHRRDDGSIDVAFYQAQAMALRAQTIGNALGPNALAKLRAPFRHWWKHVVSQAMSMLARTVPSR